MADTAIDLPYLSSHFSIPETTLSTLTQAPTIELVNQVLNSIAAKANEFDNLKSDKLRLEVELENAVRSNESKTKVLKKTVEKGHSEVEELRKKLHESENTRSTLESEISNLKSSTTTNETEVSSLKSRITSLEASNRETLALLESKSAAYDQLAEELSTQHKKTLELRRELSTAEQNLQNANSAAGSARFREQSLQQELDLTKKNNEWFDAELKTKSAEHIKFRKEKSARIAQLQRENEEANATIDSLRRSENSLKSRLDETEQRFEESIAANSQLKEDLIQATESFRIELDSSNRLAELQGSSAETAKQRVQECQLELQKAKDHAAEVISRLRVEIETENSDKQAAERRVAELEVAVGQLESERGRHRSMSPARSLNGLGPSTPMRPGTPGSTSTPRAIRTKNGLTFTQMYTEYERMRDILAAEQRTSQELRTALDEMMQELESSKPEIDELRADHARLEEAIVDMSGILEAAGKERDSAIKESRKWQGQVEGLTREGVILRQQLRDLSTQVKVLVLEVAITKKGEDYDREELEKIARNEIEDSAAELSETGRFITRNLTAFKDLHELQEQNITLRRMIRELSDKLEGDETRAKDAVRQQEAEELKDLRIRVQTYRDEIANLLAQSKSYVKERDTFRSMLTHRRQTIGEASIFSQSVPLGAVPAGAPDGQSNNNTDYAELLRKLQAHFDSYREETSTDHTALRQQVNELSRKNSELQSEISRSSSQLAAATQRAELLQNNFSMLKSENGDLHKRFTTLFENANRQELRTQQAAEDLVEAKGLVESLQRETANLKAEKDLWKSIEKRLVEDLENLRNERNRLDSLNANLQTLQNEREHTEAENRRRLQSSVESLESELQSTKRKLSNEVEDSKKATMRREYEHQQSQKRIDDLVASLGSVREELVAIKTTRDHLQSRVDELAVELKSAEERIQVLQSRPAVSAAWTDIPTVAQSSEDSSGLTREQELAIEVSELKRDLDLAKGELAHAKERVEEYQAISQSTEERMESESETHAQYRDETDLLIEEKNKTINDLESRVEEISAELAATNTEVSKLRDEQGEATRHVEEQKAILQSEITRLKDENERYITTAQFHQDDLKAQAEIAQHAQQNYESELVKHAEAAKNVQTVRTEAHQLKLEVTELRAQSENYKKDLAQKEESWVEQRARYEGELTELHKRREEVIHQNTVLHSQLENITSQISSLQRDRAANYHENDEQEGEQSAPNLEGLQEVIKFLRREKEIVEVQYHLSTQEGKRLRQQLDYTQAQLDETRLKLEQQRRAAADNEHNTLNHNKLLETLNELNLFRESSVTLRNQVKQAESALAEKSARVDELLQQIEPLETRIHELENNLEAKDGEMQLLQADRDRYQQRIQNILQKYDRVDPAEMEGLKEKLSTLEKERDEAKSSVETLQTSATAFEEQAKNAEARLSDLRNKLTEQFKARSKELSSQIRAQKLELSGVVEEKEAIQEELKATKIELEGLKAKFANSSTGATPAPVNSTPASQFPATTAQVAPGDELKIKQLEEKIQHLEATIVEKDALYAAKDAEHEAKIKEQAVQFQETLKAKMLEINAARQEQEKGPAGEQHTVAPSAATDQVPATPSKTGVTLPELSDAQVRELVSRSEVVKNIVRQNIRTMVAREREKDKQEARTANGDTATLEANFNLEREALKKSHEAELGEKVKSAVELNDKKYAARLSMNETRFKSAQAKIEVVQKAAQETPQQPVVEVWEIAKAAKPAAVSKPAASSSSAPAPAAVQQVPVAPAPAPTPAPTPAPVATAVEQPAASGQQATQSQSAPVTNNSPFGQVQQNDQNKPVSSLPVKPPTSNAPGMLRALQSGLPTRGGRGGRGGQQTQLGHEQVNQQLQNQQQSQQGQGQGQAQRGSGLPRGRGGRGGQGRGQNVANAQQQNQHQNQNQASPTNRGGLNVQAKQFVPGGKRTREEGEVAQDGGSAGKRMRGGGQTRGA
ncbi:hypothetical protein N7495_003556 [Penicillium taxi]|uniref:uncharacterized protein n=1 Tax=Penicillium taxi TaxID=168475 RepID=UPI00254579A1|nr:uncharacterized protein N7495_003556 [Penicillium taxi]KAJ5898812.1 hypothetical protein N7495_003556 [Penicillium taxi]